MPSRPRTPPPDPWPHKSLPFTQVAHHWPARNTGNNHLDKHRSVGRRGWVHTSGSRTGLVDVPCGAVARGSEGVGAAGTRGSLRSVRIMLDLPESDLPGPDGPGI